VSAAVQTEKPHHLAAFEHYLGLGPARSFKAVAEHLGRTETTVQRWARSFDWRGRVQAHDRAEARAAAPEPTPRRAPADSPHHALVKGATVQFARRLAAGDVPVRLADLERLIKLDRWLNGEGTDGPDAAPDPLATERAELERLPLAELWAAFEAEVTAVNALVAHDAGLQALEAEGRIRPLAVSAPGRLVPGEG